MTLALKALRRLAATSRAEVVLPSYTCYSVAASVIKAGLRPRIVDVIPGTLDYDPAELTRVDFDHVLAVVATNLYGLPNNLPFLARLSHERGAFLIDDAAQAMGATVGGQPSGTWGDVGLFSFDKGKNISAIDGGLLITTSDRIGGALNDIMAGVVPHRLATSAANVVKALAYSLLLRPALYGLPARIAPLGLGRTIFSTDFALAAADPVLVALATTMMGRLEEFTLVRGFNAQAFLDGLEGVQGVRLVTSADGSRAAYTRLPILMPTPTARDTAIAALTRSGIGATGSYPHALVDVPQVMKHAVGSSGAMTGGRHVAQHIVTLPTHPFVTLDDVSRAVDLLKTVVAGSDITSTRTAPPSSRLGSEKLSCVSTTFP